jgi:TetR/AcrR family transcriptional regulator
MTVIKTKGIQVMIQRKNIRKPGKQPKEVSEKTKETVLKAALKMFAREGFYNTKLREIADLAGTTHSLIRHHFGSKDDLFKAVIDYGLNLHEKRLLKIIKLNKSDNPLALFKEFIVSYVSIVAKNPELSKILMYNNSSTSPHFNYLVERQKQLHSIIQPVFKKLQQLGYFEDFDHYSFLVYVHALVEIPIAMGDMTKKLMGEDMLSRKSIVLHTERVLKFLFPEERRED